MHAGFLRLAATMLVCGTVVCHSGRVDAASQSPIDIRAEETIYDPTLPSLVFNYDVNTTLDLYNTGSPDLEATIKVNLLPGAGRVTVSGTTYELLQFHFHSEAEHLINGARGDMELHLVHQSAAGELLVVGQILHLGGTNANLAPIFSNLPQNPGEHFSVSSFNLAALLPSSLTTFRYDGSLTTAPYSEGVKWNMLTTAATLSQAQIDAFRLLFPDGDSREEQSLDGRVIRTDLQGFVPEPGTALLVLWGAIPLLITNRFRKTKATV
ncbi:MAG: carbonic anhydrase family protein [Planctomycetaceae bacterium]